MKPIYRFITLEPRELFLAIYACVLLYSGNCLVEREAAIEVSEQFFIAYRVERIEVAKRIYASCFVDHAAVNHLQYPLVDAREEFFARSVKSNLDDVEVSIAYM